MSKEYSRIQRISELIQHVLAELVQKEIQDPYLHDVTISNVVVTRDLAHAKIFVSCLADQEGDIKDKIRRLNKAAGFLRYHLANTVELRVTPQLKFIYDPSISNSARISLLVQTAILKDEGRADSES